MTFSILGFRFFKKKEREREKKEENPPSNWQKSAPIMRRADEKLGKFLFSIFDIQSISEVPRCFQKRSVLRVNTSNYLLIVRFTKNFKVFYGRRIFVELIFGRFEEAPAKLLFIFVGKHVIKH